MRKMIDGVSKLAPSKSPIPYNPDLMIPMRTLYFSLFALLVQKIKAKAEYSLLTMDGTSQPVQHIFFGCPFIHYLLKRMTKKWLIGSYPKTRIY